MLRISLLFLKFMAIVGKDCSFNESLIFRVQLAKIAIIKIMKTAYFTRKNVKVHNIICKHMVRELS